MSQEPPREPLADRMRPRTLDEFVGQHHIVGEGRLLRRAIQTDMLSSLILCGPPGCGKTTLARIIANSTRKHFCSLNAVLGGVAEVRRVVAEATTRYQQERQRTILFVDEVHRWNKAQQDALLPWVENGTVVFIGATTHNPFFEVNHALVSRSRVFKFSHLTITDLQQLIKRVLSDRERGYGRWQVTLELAAEEHLVRICDGDARSLMNALQLAVESSADFPPAAGNVITIDLLVAEESIQKKVVLYDKDGDYHFDTISAFIKSLRGSDPDAALYWMARMVAAGEDPRYIFRRMLILASEDVGLADPLALVVTESAAAAFERVGLPEGQFFLSQAALYLANAPKSNSALGYFDALKAVEEEKNEEPPTALRDASRDAKGFGHGKGYLYPHAYKDHWVAQQYLPSGLRGRLFYQPGRQGYEGQRIEEITRRREIQLAASEMGESDEQLTWSPPNRSRNQWLRRVDSRTNAMLEEIRERLFNWEGHKSLARHSRIVLCGSHLSFLLWEALRRSPEGHVMALLLREEEYRQLAPQIAVLPRIEQPLIEYGTVDTIKNIGVATTPKCDRAILHNALAYGLSATPLEEGGILIEALIARLATGGHVVMAEQLPCYRAQLSEVAQEQGVAQSLVTQLQAAEKRLAQQLPALQLTQEKIEEWCRKAHLQVFTSEVKHYRVGRVIDARRLAHWLGIETAQPAAYATALSRQCTLGQRQELLAALTAALAGKEIEWKVGVLFIGAGITLDH